VNGEEKSIDELIDILSKKFNVTTEEMEQRIPSGQKIFKYYVRRARTEYIREGLVEFTKRAHIRLTKTG
jgi:restriction system protein